MFCTFRVLTLPGAELVLWLLWRGGLASEQPPGSQGLPVELQAHRRSCNPSSSSLGQCYVKA